MSFNAIRENKILAKISEFTVMIWPHVTLQFRRELVSHDDVHDNNAIFTEINKR